MCYVVCWCSMKFEQMCGCLNEGMIICTTEECAWERTRRREYMKKRESWYILTFNLLQILLVEKKRIYTNDYSSTNKRQVEWFNLLWFLTATGVTTARMNSFSLSLSNSVLTLLLPRCVHLRKEIFLFLSRYMYIYIDVCMACSLSLPLSLLPEKEKKKTIVLREKTSL